MCGQIFEMTIRDARCDRCGTQVVGLAAPGETATDMGIRFTYHPGDPRMRDDAGMLCGRCWEQWSGALGDPLLRACARCGVALTRRSSLHLRRLDTPGNGWQLCARHAAETLNSLRTVDPKLDPDSFRLPLDREESDA